MRHWGGTLTFKQWLARRRKWKGAVGELVAYTEVDPLRVLWTTPSDLRGRLLRLQPGSPWFERVPALVAALDEVAVSYARHRRNKGASRRTP